MLFSAVYPVLEVEGGVEQQSGEPLGSPRPVTPQTPNTPLSPQGEELPHHQPTLIDLGNQLPATTASVTTGIPPPRSTTVQPKVSETSNSSCLLSLVLTEQTNLVFYVKEYLGDLHTAYIFV